MSLCQGIGKETLLSKSFPGQLLVNAVTHIKKKKKRKEINKVLFEKRRKLERTLTPFVVF